MDNESLYKTPFENPRMYKYQMLLDCIDRYLAELKQQSHNAELNEQATVSASLPEFPITIPAELQELQEYIDGTTLEWLNVYDDKILGGYNKDKAVVCHDPDICIPCHVGRPLEQPLYIQYLYCTPRPDEPHTMPYVEILGSIKSLPETEKRKFLYELRLGFLGSASSGKFHYDTYRQLKDRGPEKYYESMFTYYDKYPQEKEPGKTDEELQKELQQQFDHLIELAGKDEMRGDDADDDFVFEKNNEARYSRDHYYAAFNQLRMMRDLILQSVDADNEKPDLNQHSK